MKKTIFIFLLASLVLVGLVSCKEEVGTATLKLMLKKIDIVSEGRPKAKSFGPTENLSDVRVARYTIEGDGPGDATFNISTDSPSVTINGLKIGSWQITVTGVNAAGVPLVTGSETVDLNANTGTISITLNNLVGEGTLDLTISWLSTTESDPTLELYYKPQKGNESTLNSTAAGMPENTVKATVDLPAGSYIVRGVLKSGDFIIGGFVETVRIINGKTTSGTVSISQMQFADTSASIYLNDNMGEPVRGTLKGFEEDASGGSTLVAHDVHDISFELDDDFEATSDYQLQWFLDGTPRGDSVSLNPNGNTCHVTVTPGSHRIDAVVCNDLLGSCGVASVVFEGITTGDVGSIVKLNDFHSIRISGSEGESVTLDGNTIVSPLSGDKFLAVSPTTGKILIVKAVQNYLTVERVFTHSDFGSTDIPIGNITKAVSDGKTWVVLQEGTNNLTFLRFNTADNNLELFGSNGRAAGPWTLGTWTITFGDIKGIGFSKDSDRIYIADSSCKVRDNDAEDLMVALSIDEAQSSFKLIAKTQLDDGIGAGCETSFSPSGKFVAIAGNSSTIVTRGISQSGTSGAGSPTSHTGLTGNAQHVLMLDDNMILASGPKLQSLNIGTAGNSWQNHNVDSDLIIAGAEQKYVYAMNNAEKSVTAFAKNNGTTNFSALEGTCVISTDSGVSLTGMAMSGSYLIVSSDAGILSLCRVR